MDSTHTAKAQLRAAAAEPFRQQVAADAGLAYNDAMKLKFAFAALLALAPMSFVGPAVAQQAYCPYGQTCQNGNPNGTPVPFPVINPFAGLNVLNPGKLLQPQQQPPDQIYRPTTPTPPPVLPPTH